MICLYFLPYSGMIVLLSVLTAAGLLQTYCIVYGFFSFQYHSRNLWRTLMDTGILLQIALLIVHTAEAMYQADHGFMIAEPCPWTRRILFLFILVTAVGTCIAESAFLPLCVPLTAFSTLWGIEKRLGGAFLILLFSCIAFWIFRSLNNLFLFRRQRRTRLSAFSVKEAVDTMNFGILFYRCEPLSEGQIILCNLKMQDLMYTLTGTVMHNGKAFYERLESGNVQSECIRGSDDPLPVYTLADGHIWRFELHDTNIKKMRCVLIHASDITEFKHLSDQLYHQNAELEKRNGELAVMLSNVESICRNEEIIRAKSRVHDLLGQRISLILRSVREHREPDEELLRPFAFGLPEEIKNASGDLLYSLHGIADSFKNLGVSVHIDGELPEDNDLRKTFFEISAEAMTNSVRHAYATEIFITIRDTEGSFELNICDNGIPKDGPITEGGGLQGMRRKALELGGSFCYQVHPHFSVSVRIPKGGEA